MTAPSSECLLVIKDLNFSINGTPILKGISLDVRKGEFVGIIGPNGAGKTTLLKCINGINDPEEAVKIKGMELERMGSRKIALETAMMHQNTSITFPFPSVDIVLAGRYPHLKRMGRESAKDYEIARTYMEYTDTLKFETRPVTQISGGERQKVIFAKTLTQETDLILLDEPAANLDIAHEERIFKYSSEMCRSGKTVIAVVHDIKAASRYCTRLVLMTDGKIIADGTPDEVITSKNLSDAYGVNALVYRNRITGLLDFHIHSPDMNFASGSVHVIGGGGSASGVIRLLFENGYNVTAGVFADGDSDLNCAEVFGIKCVVCPPFSEIDEDSHAANIEMIKDAELTILCDMPFGIQNLRNLEAARFAGRLVIIEEGDPSGRDFTGGKALEAYEVLRKNAIVTTLARLHEVIG